MRDAGGELAERGELLRLHEPVLRGPQIFERARQFAGARLHLVEQADILDGDTGLVGERLDELDLPRREVPHFGSRQREHADRRAFPQDRNAQDGPVAAELLELRCPVFRVGEHVRNMDGSRFEGHPSGDAVATGHEGVGFGENRGLRQIAVVGRPAVEVAVAFEDDARVRVAQLGR